MTSDSWDFSTFNVLKGIGYSGVFGDRNVVIVWGSWLILLVGDVLEEGSKLDSIIDIGLILFGETNSLCVASTFEIEDSLFSPYVLIISNEGSMGVSTQGSLSSSG